MAVPYQPHPDTILRPSGASQWAECSGSHAMAPHYPEDPDTPEAREGTAGHFYVTESLYQRPPAAGALAPNGHPITDEMVDCGELYLEDVRNGFAEIGPLPADAVYCVEAKVFAHKTIHPKNEGTPDTFVLIPSLGLLIVWDYKYGHRYVDPFRNWQLINYAAAIFETYGITRDDVKERFRVSLRVIQPRNFHRDGPVRRWDTSGRVLVGLFDDLQRAAHRAKAAGPETRTGPWCRDCPARRGCDAFMKAAASAYDAASDTTPHDLTTHALGLELRNAKRAEAIIKARIDALEEQALATIRSGATVPFFGLGYVQSREKWNVPPAEVFALGDAMGIDLRDEQKPISPAAARKAGLDPEVSKAFTVKPTGAAKIVSDDTTYAAKAFGNY